MKVLDWDKREVVRLGDDVEVPAWFDVELSHPEWPTVVVLSVAVDSETGPRAAGVGVGRSSAATYREAQALLADTASMDEFLTHATALAAGFLVAWRTYERMPVGVELPTEQIASALGELRRIGSRQAYPVAQPRRRRRMTRKLLREVAVVYRSALNDGEAPTQAVADRFAVAHRTAGRWVSEARKAGELGPAVGPTAGESTTTEEGDE